MIVKEYSYRFAKEILEHPHYRDIYDDLILICKNAPTPLYNGKSSKQTKLDVIQQIINTYFKIVFQNKGWDSEPLITPQHIGDSLRGDFRKTFNNADIELTIQIEVEMGNTASSHRNYFKFQLSFSYNLTSICVLILPCDSLAKRIDSGLASFEKTCREISSAKLSITVPILVIGLNQDDETSWKVNDIPLPLLKGSKKNDRIQHEDIVRSYIRTRKELEFD